MFEVEDVEEAKSMGWSMEWGLGVVGEAQKGTILTPSTFLPYLCFSKYKKQ